MTPEVMGPPPPPPAGADPSSVRQWNERVVVAALADGRPHKVAETAAATGLTTASVRAVLRALGAKGWVADLAPAQAGIGRPARTYRLAQPDALTLGIDLGGRAVRAVVSDLAGDVRVIGEAAVPPRDAAGTRTVLTELLAGVPIERVWTTGLAVSGALDADGRLLRSLALAHLEGARPADVFADVLPGDVLTCHDTRSALWAEHEVGAARGVADVMLVSLGRRPSIALLLAGRLYLGAHGSAGELSLNELLLPTTGDGTTPAEARRYLADIAQVALAVGLVDPTLLVVGGALAPAFGPNLPAFTAALAARLESPPAVALTELDQFAAATGACLLARQRLWRLLLEGADGVPPLTRESFVAAAST